MRKSDGELVRETLAGSWSCFSELVERYRDAVCGVAYHYLGDFEEAQDAAQETFVRAFLRLRQLREAEKYGSWLRKIAVTVCADMQRRRGERPLSLEAQAEPAGQDGASDRAVARVVVRQALAKLSDKARLAVTLFYINGYSHSEIAGFLDVPVSTVRTRLRRAKLRLREEMTAMVSDVLQDGRPDAEFTRRAVREAMRRADEAARGYQRAEAVRQYDEALAAVDDLTAGPERQRLRMEALRAKGGAMHLADRDQSLRLCEEALGIAEELGDRAEQARIMTQLGVTSSNAGKPEQARQWYEKALALYRELADTRGQADCLYWLASQLLFAKERLEEAQQKVAKAVRLFEEANAPMWIACCRAALDLLREVDEERFKRMVRWSAVCVGLKQDGGAVRFELEPGIGSSDGDDAVGFFAQEVFYQVGQLRTFLDASVPVGGSWSGDTFSYTSRPLRTTASVLSDAERVETPAGAFENCLLMGYRTEEGDPDEEASDRQRELNRGWLCGVRRAWYARGVGMVQLQVQRHDGAEATLRLKEYSAEPSDDRLPLAAGNFWMYGHDTPGYIDKESYRATTREDGVWCLEHYDYLYKE